MNDDQYVGTLTVDEFRELIADTIPGELRGVLSSPSSVWVEYHRIDSLGHIAGATVEYRHSPDGLEIRLVVYGGQIVWQRMLRYAK